MKLSINKKEDNPLLHRTEVYGEMSFEGATPSNADIAAAIASELKADQPLVVVKHIYTKFSVQEAVFHAVVYKTAEARAKAEKMTKHLRKEAEAAAKKAAEESKAAEEAKEAPAQAASEESQEAAPEETKEAPAEEHAEEKAEKPAEEKTEEAAEEKPEVAAEAE